MKALLINPFSIVPPSWMPYPPHEPLGLEYLAAIALPYHEVSIFDCRGEFPWRYEAMPNKMYHVGASLEEIRSVILNWVPELVGITSPFVTQIPSVYSIVNLVKEVDKTIITVVGGVTVSCYPEKVLEENENIDIVVSGEGELTFRELLDKRAEGLDTINGIIYRNKGKIVRNTPRELIKNLDELPFPRRDVVPFRNYSPYRGFGRLKGFIERLKFKDKKCKAILSSLRRHSPRHSMHGSSQVLNPGIHNVEAKILTSRGCPFNCYYCAVRNVWGNTYRVRSAANVLDEITFLYEQYDVTHFGIVDDNFNLSRKRTVAICRGVIEQGLKVSFRADSGVYLPTIDKETLSIMKKAGFNELYFGIESGNQDVLHNVLNKKVDLRQVEEVAQHCRDLGIVSGGYFMIGVPGETKETMEQTVEFALNSQLDRIRLYICQPFPGSRLYEDWSKKWMDQDGFEVSKALIFENRAYIQTDDFSPEDVMRIAEKVRAALHRQNRLDM